MSKSGMRLRMHSHGLLDDGEGLQAEEVHLEQAHLGERLHGILGDDFAFVAAGERDDVRRAGGRR